MVYTGLSGLFIVVAILIAFFAVRLLFKKAWIMGWLRGSFGLFIFAVAVISALAALDFYTYKQLTKEQTVANLSFSRLGPQHYKVSLVDSLGEENLYEVKGDLWQLDARILKWNPALAKLGLSPGYRLDRLSGRYFSLEKESTAERTVYQLYTQQSLLDVWLWLQQNGAALGLINAQYGSATYLPMEDNALFSVSLTASGLLARPLNDPAKIAVAGWQ
jgi:hypothetical protein